jgi:hypothetical protein
MKDDNILYELYKKSKGKAVPLQAWSGPEGSRKLRFPDFTTTAQDGGKVVSLMHRPPLPRANTPGTRFCERLSRPQGHSVTGRNMSLKNSNDTIGSMSYMRIHIVMSDDCEPDILNSDSDVPITPPLKEF